MNNEYLRAGDLSEPIKDRRGVGILAVAPPHIVAFEALPADSPASTLHTNIVEVQKEDVLAEVVDINHAFTY
jgi:hypothetical protein